jgi:putative endonuclease
LVSGGLKRFFNCWSTVYPFVSRAPRSTKWCAADPGPRLGAATMRDRFFVYILSSRYRGTLYTGVTSELSQRVGQHKSGAVRGFTKQYKVKTLVYFEEYSSILEARAREHVLKRWRRDWKFELIENLNPDWRDLTLELIML